MDGHIADRSRGKKHDKSTDTWLRIPQSPRGATWTKVNPLSLTVSNRQQSGQRLLNVRLASPTLN